VLALSDGRTPTKDQIVLKADPAMARLKELLTVSSTSVRSSDQRLKLKRRREELLELITIWAQAFEVWASANQDAVNAADTSGKGAAGPKGNGTRTSKITASNQPPDKAQFEQELGFLEEFAAHLATPMPATDKQTLIANFRLRSKIDEAEAAGVLKLNLMRIQLGLNAVSIDLKLTHAARGHSKDMQTKKFFSHTSPLPGKSRFTDRAKLSGTTANAENIYMGRTSPDAAIMAWWHSPGHHVNMMGPYKRIGLGRYDRHWTQMFGR